MNIEGKTIWQVAAGNGSSTHYADKCLAQGVIVVGPGHCGAWPHCEPCLRQDGVSSRRIGIVKRFAETMKSGDIVVLRVGTQHVYGVGELVGGYSWSNDFGNMDGWDLQHFRRVRWLRHQDGAPKTFPVYALKLGNSVQRLISSEVRQWLEALEIADA